MKNLAKYALVSLVVLLAAGCNSATQPQPQTPSQVNNFPQQPSSPPPADLNPTSPPPTGVQKNSQATPTPQDQEKSYTMDEVKAANSESKCWTAVNGKVFDLTPALNKHPGGKAAIMLLCGTDGTAAFNKKHGKDEKPINMLAGLQIGVLK